MNNVTFFYKSWSEIICFFFELIFPSKKLMEIWMYPLITVVSSNVALENLIMVFKVLAMNNLKKKVQKQKEKKRKEQRKKGTIGGGGCGEGGGDSVVQASERIRHRSLGSGEPGAIGDFLSTRAKTERERELTSAGRQPSLRSRPSLALPLASDCLFWTSPF